MPPRDGHNCSLLPRWTSSNAKSIEREAETRQKARIKVPEDAKALPSQHPANSGGS